MTEKAPATELFVVYPDTPKGLATPYKSNQCLSGYCPTTVPLIPIHGLDERIHGRGDSVSESRIPGHDEQ